VARLDIRLTISRNFQLLIALDDALGDRAFDYFDWVAGTSTGSYIAAALTKGARASTVTLP